MVVDLLISAVVQVILFSIIPLIWWLISGRKETGFFKWLGLKKIIISNKKEYCITFAMIILIFLLPSMIIPYFIETSTLATSQFANKGMAAIVPAFIYAFIQTGFSEELFFRGFLAKRLIHKFGFQVGNTIQGVLFGSLHGIMILPIAGVPSAIIVIIITFVAGYLMGWINEKQSGGSILSS